MLSLMLLVRILWFVSLRPTADLLFTSLPSPFQLNLQTQAHRGAMSYPNPPGRELWIWTVKMRYKRLWSQSTIEMDPVNSFACTRLFFSASPRPCYSCEKPIPRRVNVSLLFKNRPRPSQSTSFPAKAVARWKRELISKPRFVHCHSFIDQYWTNGKNSFPSWISMVKILHASARSWPQQIPQHFIFFKCYRTLQLTNLDISNHKNWTNNK